MCEIVCVCVYIESWLSVYVGLKNLVALMASMD